MKVLEIYVDAQRDVQCKLADQHLSLQQAADAAMYASIFQHRATGMMSLHTRIFKQFEAEEPDASLDR